MLKSQQEREERNGLLTTKPAKMFKFVEEEEEIIYLSRHYRVILTLRY